MSFYKTLLATSRTPCIVMLPHRHSWSSVLSDLQAYRVVFNTGVGEGRCDLLRRAGNRKQLLQPSHNLSPFLRDKL
jgi:hypothetical protein